MCFMSFSWLPAGITVTFPSASGQLVAGTEQSVHLSQSLHTKAYFAEV